MPQLPHTGINCFMSNATIKPWVESVILHPDVLSPNFSEDIFALDLGPLADGNKNVPAVYRDPEQFFRASYLTSGLNSLLQDVLSRLSGGAGNRVLKLVTPFGGGKSHTLAAVYHAARNSPCARNYSPVSRKNWSSIVCRTTSSLKSRNCCSTTKSNFYGTRAMS